MLKSTETRYVKNFWFYDTDEMIGSSLDHYGEYGQTEVDLMMLVPTLDIIPLLLPQK